MTDHDELAARFRAVLDRMAQSRNCPNELQEEAHDDAVHEIARMPRNKELLAALNRAVGRSKLGWWILFWDGSRFAGARAGGVRAEALDRRAEAAYLGEGPTGPRGGRST